MSWYAIRLKQTKTDLRKRFLITDAGYYEIFFEYYPYGKPSTPVSKIKFPAVVAWEFSRGWKIIDDREYVKDIVAECRGELMKLIESQTKQLKNVDYPRR